MESGERPSKPRRIDRFNNQVPTIAPTATALPLIQATFRFLVKRAFG